jgi:hypothetical protein
MPYRLSTKIDGAFGGEKSMRALPYPALPSSFDDVLEVIVSQFEKATSVLV